MAHWTGEEIDALDRMAAKGCTLEQICTVLKSRTSDAINSMASKRGLSLAGKKPEIDYAAFERILSLPCESLKLYPGSFVNSPGPAAIFSCKVPSAPRPATSQGI